MKKTQLFKKVSEILSICIFLSGSVVLIGWICDIPVLKSVSPNFVAMKANTAICFIFIGLSLWLLQLKWQANRTARIIARICAFAVFFTGFLTFLEYVLGLNFGVDQFLFKESASAILTSSAGRMAFNTSIIFMIIGIALLIYGFEVVFPLWPAQLLIIFAGIITLLSFVGYLYDASPLYIGLRFNTAMAVHTCVLFIISCLGCLLARPQQGLMKNVSSDNYGGMMFRRILPVVIVVPLVLGWFKIHGEATGLFGDEFGVSFVATCNLFIVGLFVYILSVYLNRLDAKRKQTEERMNNSQKLLQRIINILPVRVFWKDENLKYLGCNEIFAKDAGKNSPEDLIGQDDFQMSWKEQAEIYRNDDQSVMNSGISKLAFEELQTTPNGEKIWLKTSKVPLTDFQGNTIGVLGTYEDITGCKQAEETLRKRECYYRELINNTADAIFVHAVPSGRIIDCNNRACTSLGYSREEMLCLSVSDIDAKFAKDRDVKVWEEIKPGMTATLLGFHKKKDGFVFPVEVNIVVVADAEENIAVAVARDITERKQAEDEMKTLNEKLEEANQELKNFVYIASHDLKEPLRKISAFGEMLQKSLGGKITGDDSENLNFMIDGSNRMTKMIEGLLVYSKVSSKMQPVENVDLNEIVRQLSGLELSVMLEEKHTTIDVPSPLPEVEVDPVQIRQLMQNLIANGMKYQAKNNVPRITITSKPAADNMVRINITDNGIGIAPEFQQAIFVMFKRLHSKNEYEGTGIGLAVCKKIVERHGGQIGVESEPGKGSTFWFTVPAAKQSVIISQELKTYV